MSLAAHLDAPGHAFVDPALHAEPQRWHAETSRIRAQDPVHWVDHPDFYPFWALTRHADVRAVELNSDEFHAHPRGMLVDKSRDDRVAERGHRLSSLTQMDGPRHAACRAAAASWFRASSLRKLDGQIGDLVEGVIDAVERVDGDVDFAVDIALDFPLQVIMHMMGLPEHDYPLMLTLTQELFGAADPDLARDGAQTSGVSDATLEDFFRYFRGVTSNRRANPTDDYCSAIANAEIDGEPMAEPDQMGLYIIAATAGHDTTSYAMSGGMQALLDHPEQLARLQEHPELIDTAVDEMIRWTSPVKSFVRTAAQTTDVGGTTIAEGEHVLLSYWSANRDETVFDDPFRFDVGRQPNRHLGFGFGMHFCLGAMLARMEMRRLFGALVPRIASVEPTGDAVYSQSNFVGGVKRLPVRITLTNGAAT